MAARDITSLVTCDKMDIAVSEEVLCVCSTVVAYRTSFATESGYKERGFRELQYRWVLSWRLRVSICHSVMSTWST